MHKCHKIKRSDIPRQEIIDACRAFHQGRTQFTPERTLAEKYPVKVVMARMSQMVIEGLLDYGVSLRTAWVVADLNSPTTPESPPRA